MKKKTATYAININFIGVAPSPPLASSIRSATDLKAATISKTPFY